MEYIEGGDLMALIRRQQLTENEGQKIARQLLEGLKIMHKHHICHRDLKPEVCRFTLQKVVITYMNIECSSRLRRARADYG